MEEGINIFSIKDLESFSGIKAHTIRIWEKRYKLLEPDRTASNIRTYSETELKKILNVAYLNRNGLKISRIAGLGEDEITANVINISGRNGFADKNFKPDRILTPAMRFKEAELKDLLQQYIADHGLEDAYINYLQPLLNKSKILWQTGMLSRAQEQFVKNSIREIIIIEDNNLRKSKSGKQKTTVAMINTYSNQTDINFLFYKYILKKTGFNVIYSGGVLPASEIVEIHKIKPFEFLVVNAGAAGPGMMKTDYLSSLGRSLLLKKIILADYPNLRERKISGNILIASTSADFIKLAHSLT